MARRSSRQERVAAYLESRRIERVGAQEWRALLEATGLAESALRRALRDLNTPADQPFAGIRQKTLAELEDSLLEMSRVYEAADAEQRRYCRRVVIEAKDHARLAGRHTDLREIKAEMVEWMLVWLGSPEVFPVWVRLRKQTLSATSTPA